MRCRYCNTALAPLRSLADDEFCCDDHRNAFHEQQAATPTPPEAPEAPAEAEAISEPVEPVIPVAPVDPEVPIAVRILRMKLATPLPSVAREIAQPVIQEAEPVIAPPEAAFSEAPEPPALPEPALDEPALEQPVLEQSVELPVEEFEPAAETSASEETEVYASESNESVAAEPAEAFAEPYQYSESNEAEAYPVPEFCQEDEPAEATRSRITRNLVTSWGWIRTTWHGAPRDLKLVTFALPILAAIAVTGSFPKVPIETVAPANVAQVEKVVNEQWKNLNQTISNRAAIAYADDFRSGLDAWQSRSNLTTSWSYDQAGFVRPGPLALFKPSLDLADYRVEFLGEIDQKAIGWVFRAEDLKNYYAMKLLVVKPGPLPLVDLVRYAVIDGKEGPQIHKPLPMTVRADMLYRVMVDVRGADFTVMAQGQVVDFWSDHRLQHGGVGFFSNRGERSRLRWVEVSHQYDALGRVCAYLAPYGMEGRNGSFN
jgi:hypothetical protein